MGVVHVTLLLRSLSALLFDRLTDPHPLDGLCLRARAADGALMEGGRGQPDSAERCGWQVS